MSEPRITKKYYGWTPERKRLIYKLWNDDVSIPDIMKIMGISSRNTVLGAIYRLRLRYGDDLKWGKRSRECGNKNGLPQKAKDFLSLKPENPHAKR